MSISLKETLRNLEHQAEQIARQLRKTVSVHVSCDDVLLDSKTTSLLNESLTHLIRNAIDHGIEKSGDLFLSAKKTDSTLTLEVRDNGSGIDPGIQKKIFEPGFTTKKAVTEFSGRGVGLDVVKTNLKKLNGDVSLKSAPGKGAAFTLVLKLP